jgi:hypothetical protein
LPSAVHDAGRSGDGTDADACGEPHISAGAGAPGLFVG